MEGVKELTDAEREDFAARTQLVVSQHLCSVRLVISPVDPRKRFVGFMVAPRGWKETLVVIFDPAEARHYAQMLTEIADEIDEWQAH